MIRLAAKKVFVLVGLPLAAFGIAGRRRQRCLAGLMDFVVVPDDRAQDKGLDKRASVEQIE